MGTEQGSMYKISNDVILNGKKVSKKVWFWKCLIIILNRKDLFKINLKIILGLAFTI